jgi:ATP-binding cassette subfamily F protein uup
LNNVVSSTLMLQGDGQVKESAGGYDDAARANAATTPLAAETAKPAAKPASAPPTAERPRKLSYQEKRELDALPATIAKLETEQQQLHETLADPSFYRQAGPQIAETKSLLSAVDEELLKAYARWEELEKG